MTYPRNCWYVSSWSHDLPVGKPVGIQILNESIVLWRTPEGAVNALEDRCPHRLAPLSIGRCEGANLRCMYHGFLFNGEGKTIAIPGQDMIPPQAKVRTYPVSDRHGWIWIWMGDAEAADENLIPVTYGPDDDQWVQGAGYLDYDAEAQLINDNLLDFSHLSFVHANSFGGGDEESVDPFSASPPKITPLERGVRITRWVGGTPGPANGIQPPYEDPVDWWLSYDYVAPGILIMQSASFEPGSAKKWGPDGPPDFALSLRARAVTSQAVTPTVTGKARYFFCTGPHRDHGGEAQRDAMVDLAHMAFGEDKVMIEAQHQVISRSPGVRMVPSVHDKAVTIFNGIMRKLEA